MSYDEKTQPNTTLHAELDNRFTYHRPHESQPPRYERIREAGRQYAHMLAGLCPQSRELWVALIKLDEVVFWANAAIARNEHPEPASLDQAKVEGGVCLGPEGVERP
jgi:hypothetical protein